MSDRLVGITAKIDRADKHIRDFQGEWTGFAKRAYEIFSEEDGDRRTFRVRIKEDPPPYLSTIVGDAVVNLRTALDYLIYQLLDANSQPITRYHYFPIAENAEVFSKSYLRKIKGVGQTAEQLIASLKPYKGGNDLFFYLNELCRKDKHRLLVMLVINPSALALNLGDMVKNMPPIHGTRPGYSREMDEMAATLGGRFLVIHGGKTPCLALKDGDIVFSEPLDLEHYQRTGFGFEIAFAQGEVLECQPVSTMLRQSLDLVRDTVQSFRPLLT